MEEQQGGGDGWRREGSTDPSGERVPVWGGAGRGGRLLSEEYVLSLRIDRGDYVSIYNWPQSEWLKRGDRPPQARITVTAVLGAHGVKTSGTFTERLLCAWGLSPAAQAVVTKTWQGSEREGPLSGCSAGK